MFRRTLIPLLTAMCMVCAIASPTLAQGRFAPGPYGPEVLPLDRLLPTVRLNHPGRFYDAEGPFPDEEGNYHYRLKWLTPEGRLIWLDTDARSGRVLGVARGDWREQERPYSPGGPFYNGARPEGYPPSGGPYPGPDRGGYGPPGRGGFGPPGRGGFGPPGRGDFGGWRGGRFDGGNHWHGH
jgi:hypothetical protein